MRDMYDPQRTDKEIFYHIYCIADNNDTLS